MKKKSLFYVILCTCLFCSCEKEEIETSPVVPPVEQPDNPDESNKPENKPSTEDIINIKINENTMAIVGTENWNDIAYGNGKYVTISNRYITESTDGSNWSTPQMFNNYNTLYDSVICFGNGKWCARSRTLSAVSSDLQKWDTITDKLYFTAKNSVFFENAFFACGENSKLIYLKDGAQSWSSFNITNTPVKDFYSMVVNDDNLIVVGHKRDGGLNGGYIYVINNFEVKETIESNINIRFIAFGKGIYVGMSSTGVIYYSTDLKNWSIANFSDSSIFPSPTPIHIEYKNGVFIAFLQTSSGYYKALISLDGKNWDVKDIGIDKSKKIRRILIL